MENRGCGQRWGDLTYAQHSDDLVIINLFELMGIDKPTWIDVGANHPFAISNTALLYSRGCRGVNIEANPDLMPEFYKHRPDDKNINVGIAPASGEFNFYLFRDGDGLNTFDPLERDQTIASGNPVKEVISIHCMTLNMAVDLYCDGKWPNLLSMDVEGLDFDILSKAQFPILGGPDLVCVETRRHASQKMTDMMHSKGYALVIRMAENLIFARQDQYKKGY